MNISVTIAFKGRERIKGLVKCLQSFLNQTLSASDIVVVGSEYDLSGLEKYFSVKELRTIKIIYSEAGKNEARNIGIKACRGDCVIFADHDMRAAKNLLEACHESAVKYDVLFIPEKGAGGNFWENCRKLQKEFVHYDVDTISPRFFRKNIFSPDAKPFNSNFGELDEWGFNLQIAKKKIPIGIVNSYFTVVEDNLTLGKEIRNKYRRGLWMPSFYKNDRNEAWRRINPIKRGVIFYSKRINYFFIDPIHFLGLLFFKTISLLAFFSGALIGLIIKRDSIHPLKEQTKNLYDKLSHKYLYDMYKSSDWNKYVDFTEKETVKKIWNLDGNNSINDQVILDLGMGPGRWSKFFLKFNFRQVVGVDISPKMVEVARGAIKNKRFKCVLGDIEKLPFAHNSFDKIFCFRTFKYLPNPKQALLQMLHVLKDNGEIIIEFTNNNLQNRAVKLLSRFVFNNKKTPIESNWRYFNRTNFYSLEGFKKMVVEAGNAKLVKFYPLFVLPSMKISQKFGILSKIFIYVDDIFMKILPKDLFVRSWVVVISKN